MRRLSSYGPSLIVLFTVGLLLMAGPSAVRRLTWHQTSARIQLAGERLESNTVLEQLNLAYRDLATLVEPSVVHISTERLVRERFGSRAVPAAGSGWVYDAQGHIVTNFHVIQDARRIQVQTSTGDIFPAEVVGSDQFTDIAVIRVPTTRVHAAQRAAPGDEVRQGDLVFAFGSPFDFRFSMSSGVVSGVGRSVGVIRNEAGMRGYENFIQVDAAINPGNSGGPLTDIRGRVIGMNTAIATAGRQFGSFDEGQFAGIGLAIPVEMIEPVVEQIIEARIVQKGFIGVQVVAIPDEVSERTMQRLQARGFEGRGIGVTWLDEDGPAERAGLKLNDIVTSVNESPVATVDQLRSIISSMLPGETARLEVWRYDEDRSEALTLKLEVMLSRLDTRRVLGTLPADQLRDRLEPFGIASMETSTRELAEHYRVEFVPGVMVRGIVAGSQIDGRIPPGSILVAVRERQVDGVDELFDELAGTNLRSGAEVRVTFRLPDGRLDPLLLTMP